MADLFSPRNLLGVVGVMLFLIALYLVLEHAGGFSKAISAIASGTIGIFGVLQGRSVSGTNVPTVS